jgi:hypothetical protein
MFPRQVFGLCRIGPTCPDFPERRLQCRLLGVRTCLPLRGSSGFSPDSLFTLLAKEVTVE